MKEFTLVKNHLNVQESLQGQEAFKLMKQFILERDHSNVQHVAKVLLK